MAARHGGVLGATTAAEQYGSGDGAVDGDDLAAAVGGGRAETTMAATGAAVDFFDQGTVGSAIALAIGGLIGGGVGAAQALGADVDGAIGRSSGPDFRITGDGELERVAEVRAGTAPN